MCNKKKVQTIFEALSAAVIDDQCTQFILLHYCDAHISLNFTFNNNKTICMLYSTIYYIGTGKFILYSLQHNQPTKEMVSKGNKSRTEKYFI